jgi:hypothetical protein
MDPAAAIAQNVVPQAPQPASQPEPSYSADSPSIEFPVPSGFTPPDEIKPGEAFQAMGTFRMKDDGTMCLLAVDGNQVTPPKEEEAEQSPSSMPDAMKKGMAAAGMPA